MENLSHSRQPNKSGNTTLSKKACNGSSNNNFVTRTTYDDVFGGPPKFGVPSLAPRVDDYSEIFGGFHASRAGSIPVLDLPVVEEEDVFFDVSSSGFDYDEVFGGGGFDGRGFAVSFEELLREQSNGVGCCGDVDSSEEAWTPAETESLAEESDHSGKNQSLSNRGSYESIDGSMEFNISYHKANQRSDEDMLNGITHVTQVHDVTGYAFLVNKTTPLGKTYNENPSLQMTDDSNFEMDFSGRQKNLRKTMSHPANSNACEQTFESGCKSQRGYRRISSLPNETFVTISEVSLRTLPSEVPPPCRPAPLLDDKKGDFSEVAKNSETIASEGTTGDTSPPFFDVEVDASSSAAASAAAMKEAMEKAQARLKNAKELLERKRERRHSRKERKDREGKVFSNVDGPSIKDERVHASYERQENGMTYSVREERPKVLKTSRAVSDSIESQKLFNVDKTSEMYRQYDKLDGTGEWKEATQFFELVRTDRSQAFEQAKSDEIFVPNTKIHDLGQKDKKGAMEPVDHLQVNDKKTKANSEDSKGGENGRKLKVTRVACEQLENNGRSEASKAARKHKGHEKKTKVVQEVCERGENEKKLRMVRHLVENEKKPTVDQSAKPENPVEVQQKDNRSEHEKAIKHAENEQLLKEASRSMANERRSKGSFEREDDEKRRRDAFKREESDRKLKEAREREESENRVREALEQMENEKRLKEEHEKKRRETLEQMENEKRLKEEREKKKREALEQMENEKRLKEEREKKRRETLEQVENEKRLKEEREKKRRETLEQLENEKRLKEEREKKRREALEQLENEKRLKEEREKKRREALEQMENEKRLKEEREKKRRETLEQMENEKRLKEEREKKRRETLEQMENEKRLKEECEKKRREALEQMENETRLKEEHEKKRRETLEQMENEKRLIEECEKKRREAFELEQNEKRLIEECEKKRREAFELEQNERRLKEFIVQEENEKKQREASEREENEKRLKEALELEAMGKRLDVECEQGDNIKTLRQAQETAECEMRSKEAFEKEVTGNTSEEARVETEDRLSKDGEMEDLKGLSRAHEQTCWDENGKKLKMAEGYPVHIVEEDLRGSDKACMLDDIENLQAARLASQHEENSNKVHKNVTFSHEGNGNIQTEPRDNEMGSQAVETENVLVDGVFEVPSLAQGNLEHEELTLKMEDVAEPFLQDHSAKRTCQSENFQSAFQMESETKKQGKKIADEWGQRENNIREAQVGLNQKENKDKFMPTQPVESIQNERKMEAAQPSVSEGKGNIHKTAQRMNVSQSAERKEKNVNKTRTSEKKEVDRIKRETELEKERLRKIEEEREREREREKDRMAVDLATLEARERAHAEVRERQERNAVERATSEARQRALTEARERLEKACAEAKEKTFGERSSMEARLRAERAAVERATAEARERAVEKAMAGVAFESKERVERTFSEKFSSSSRNGSMRPNSSSSDLQDQKFQRASSFSSSKYHYSVHGASNNTDRSEGVEGESAQRCKARLERHQRTAERAAKALAEKNMRDLLVQREQTERNRLAETLDADVKRWSSGKEGNLRALLSTLQYILGPDNGWHPIPLTEVITSPAVKKAYRKATLCVHPDKLQQRGASIQQKYICEKVFDLLKEAWNKFNSEER
ncbi:hypothetical protein LWI29_037325 [Acer saccharum]|uniref:J domain-containing protein n=1 Tax=Acer saccharum TaxID=4024 RepID=A0AA39W8E2_ACESA|nr:hypothetical protein LWI29_037325 [Acer saccharum]